MLSSLPLLTVTSFNDPDTLHNVHVELQWISPDKARDYLATNVCNRACSKTAVKRWADTMKAGAWKLSSDAIAFDWNGVLINGQHRLNALIATGATMPFLVAHNFPPESKNALDVGKKRSLHEILTINGYPITINETAICKFIMTPWEKGTVTNPDHEVHRHKLKQVHQRLKAEIDFVMEQTKFKEFAAPELAAIVQLMARSQDPELVGDFISLLRGKGRLDGTFKKQDEIVNLYRDHTIRTRARGFRVSGMDSYRLLATVAYKFLNGESPKNLRPLAQSPFTNYAERV